MRRACQSAPTVDIWCGEVKTHLEAAADPQVEHMKAITPMTTPRPAR
jgi:crotonobetainyl-CoA:carnitine CoA-transferase CaiB-like acyl-CoA transferase